MSCPLVAGDGVGDNHRVPQTSLVGRTSGAIAGENGTESDDPASCRLPLGHCFCHSVASVRVSVNPSGTPKNGLAGYLPCRLAALPPPPDPH
jgi:hypothetical protein